MAISRVNHFSVSEPVSASRGVGALIADAPLATAPAVLDWKSFHFFLSFFLASCRSHKNESNELEPFLPRSFHLSAFMSILVKRWRTRWLASSWVFISSTTFDRLRLFLRPYLKVTANRNSYAPSLYLWIETKYSGDGKRLVWLAYDDDATSSLMCIVKTRAHQGRR